MLPSAKKQLLLKVNIIVCYNKPAEVSVKGSLPVKKVNNCPGAVTLPLTPMLLPSLTGKKKSDRRFVQSPSFPNSFGLFTRWICKMKPKDLGNVPCRVPGFWFATVTKTLPDPYLGFIGLSLLVCLSLIFQILHFMNPCARALEKKQDQ